MATQAFQVHAPENFNFSSPLDWPRWRKKFERFLVVSGLGEKDELNQIEMLMYLMGDKADDVFRTLKFGAADDHKKIKKVLEAFEKHFIVRRNVIYERALFNTRIQEESESVDEFITSLYRLAEHCDYKTLNDEMIRDRIVVGVRDKQLSEKLQLDNALTLERAVNQVRSHDAVRKQQKDLQCRPPSPKIDQVKKHFQKKNFYSKPTNEQEKTGGSKESSSEKCGRCGKSHWKGKPCPALEAECRKCNRKGHYSSCCKTKAKAEKSTAAVKEVALEENKEDAFMMALTTSSKDDNERKQRWRSTIMIDNAEINFKLDPGADVNVIPNILFKKTWKNRKLQPADLNLRAADGNYLKCIGMFDTKMKFKDKLLQDKIYVASGVTDPLLSLKACEQLGLVKRLDEVESKTLTDVNPKDEYPELFKGIGCVTVGNPYEIKLKEDSTPFAVHTPRRVPIPLMKKLQARLDEYVRNEIIRPVEEATEWCAPTVITGKPNGDIRLCVDLTRLNQCLEREVHPMPVVEHMLGQLGGAKLFTKLDANSGFHQIKLNEKSQLLTTFITPFGRFCFQRLPFGITTAPEYFQRMMTTILQGVENVVCFLDDILISAETKEQHDTTLRIVLQRLKKAGVTLNESKCAFGKREVSFLGHIVSGDGIRPDPKKIEAVINMPELTNVSEVRRFLGLVNQLGKFVKNLSEESAPLNQLLCADQEFIWGPSQKKSFTRLKELLTNYPVLALYEVNRKTMVSSDASSYGCGALIKQEGPDGVWRTVAYASRTMTDAEKRYAQIEKEALAITWACERFEDFLIGKHFSIETDHKPLVPIFTTKELGNLTPRLQRFRMRMMRFSFDIYHTPGKDLIAADALSRQPLKTEEEGENENLAAAHINAVLSCLPVTDERLSEIWKAQQEDATLRKIDEFSTNGWPEKKKLDAECQLFWPVRFEIGSENGMLMRGCRIVIPKSMRAEMLEKLHTGHLGITKCRSRARETMWWPGISSHIETMIKKCTVCIQKSSNRHEPLMTTDFPTRPWQKIAMDLFHYNKKWFLVVVDYYSRYPEIVSLERLTAELVIRSCKSIFARHGVPETVISDNGTQFGDPTRQDFLPGASREFAKFATEYGFFHQTSSPKFPQSNGMAEAAVKIVKMLFKKNEDAQKALMEYRATPLENGYSPAELLMGRKIRTTVPSNPVNLQPKTVDPVVLSKREEKRKERMKSNYDKRYGARGLDELVPGETVWIIDMKTWGRVVKKASTPRSYLIETPTGILRRNRFHLKKGYDYALPEDNTVVYENEQREDAPAANNQQRDDGPPRSRYGRVLKQPNYYKP